MAIFVPRTAIGDIVEVQLLTQRRRYAIAEVPISGVYPPGGCGRPVFCTIVAVAAIFNIWVMLVNWLLKPNSYANALNVSANCLRCLLPRYLAVPGHLDTAIKFSITMTARVAL